MSSWPLVEGLSERESRCRLHLRGIRAGDAESLAALYDEAGPLLYSLAHRIAGSGADAEEVIVDVFQQVWTGAHQFDPQRGSVWSWLALLTRSRAIDKVRSATGKRQHEQTAADWVLNVASTEPHPEEASIYTQNQFLMRRALSMLPQDQREALELAYYSDLTHVEIASRLGVPLGTIKTRIRSGMQKLRYAVSTYTGSIRELAQ